MFFPSIFAPEILALAIPELVMYTIARKPPYDWHIYATISIFAIACVIGMSRLLFLTKGKPSWFWKSPKSKTTLFIISLLALTANPLVNFYHSYNIWKVEDYHIQEVNLEALRQVKSYVPPNSYLAVTSDLMIHFVNRSHLLGPEEYHHADYIMVNVRTKGIHYRHEV